MTQTGQDFFEASRRRLIDERDRLLKLRQGVSEETSGDDTERSELQELSSIDQHPADVGSELFEREKDIAVIGVIETELTDIEDALARIDSGSYGSCETCRREIPRERLEALPHARFCVEDQAKAERTVQ